jgi:hypothetical protein
MRKQTWKGRNRAASEPMTTTEGWSSEGPDILPYSDWFTGSSGPLPASTSAYIHTTLSMLGLVCYPEYRSCIPLGALVPMYQATWQHIPEDSNVHCKFHENFKSELFISSSLDLLLVCLIFCLKYLKWILI